MTEQLRSLVLPEAQRRAFLEEVRASLPLAHYERIEAMTELLPELLQLLEQKSMSIGRLRKLVFGATTESARNLCGGTPKAPPTRGKRRGHGRRGQVTYTGAVRVWVAHQSLKDGELCPDCGKGKLRRQKRPTTVVTVSAQPPVGASIHELERLRCDGCGAVFTAATPADVAPEKYDANVGVMVGLMRYGGGMPFQRLERLQESVGVPLPSSIQWEQANQTAEALDEREEGLVPPLHMSDGLACNEPKGHVTQSCKCSIHARRNFVDIQGAFPEECKKVVESFAVIYRVEGRCRKERLDPIARLKLHQAESGPEIDRLKSWFTEQMDERKVEPNSGLGQAIGYMLDRWEPLTRFLVVPGAPLDNNVTERLLKTSILHRKNSLHYRTARGAEVGDIFMSVIQTCVANLSNPFDYMVAVVKNRQAVQEDPARWMPWNYKETLTVAGASNSRPG